MFLQLASSSLGQLADDFGPNKAIGNPLFMQKTNSFALASPSDSSQKATSFLFSSPLAASLDDDGFGDAIPEEVDAEVSLPIALPQRGVLSSVPPPPSFSPNDGESSSTDTATAGRLPFKQTIKKTIPREADRRPAPNDPLPSLPFDNRPRTVRALNLVKDLPFEVLCAAKWGENFLFGTDAGLVLLETNGTSKRYLPAPF